MTRRALLSVSDKTGLLEFAMGLHDRGFELVSTGGTARVLADAGLPVTPVSRVTGVPEMMDGRVKTLHPRIHGGILARRDVPDHLEDARRHEIGLIDVVAVNLYPFQRAAADPSTPFEDLVEEIDIGGPSMVRSAAKNFRDVLIVVSPGDYPYVLEALDAPNGPPLSFRLTLSQRAFAHTAEYDGIISSTLARYGVTGPGRFARQGDLASEQPSHDATASFAATLHKLKDLRYGENPHQWAALYAGWEEHFEPFRILQGKELSFTNLLDLDAAARIALEFEEPSAVVIKHTNPCGVATGGSAAEAYVRARDADALSAFGGIVGLNRTLDEDTARAITSTFIEAVIAPVVDPAALPVLSTKSKMRVVTWNPDRLTRKGGSPFEGTELKSILGGVLVQVRDEVLEARHHWPDESLGIRVVTRRQPTDEEWQALRFAWRVCAHVKSNTVIFTGAERTLAVGAGQMSRVDAVRVAVMKAETSDVSLARSVAASDAFFPFRDALDALATAGATAVVQPGGSVRDAEVIAAADEHGIAMVFTGRRHFRH